MSADDTQLIQTLDMIRDAQERANELTELTLYLQHGKTADALIEEMEVAEAKRRVDEVRRAQMRAEDEAAVAAFKARKAVA